MSAIWSWLAQPLPVPQGVVVAFMAWAASGYPLFVNRRRPREAATGGARWLHRTILSRRAEWWALLAKAEAENREHREAIEKFTALSDYYASLADDPETSDERAAGLRLAAHEIRVVVTAHRTALVDLLEVQR